MLLRPGQHRAELLQQVGRSGLGAEAEAFAQSDRDGCTESRTSPPPLHAHPSRARPRSCSPWGACLERSPGRIRVVKAPRRSRSMLHRPAPPPRPARCPGVGSQPPAAAGHRDLDCCAPGAAGRRACPPPAPRRAAAPKARHRCGFGAIKYLLNRYTARRSLPFNPFSESQVAFHFDESVGFSPLGPSTRRGKTDMVFEVTMTAKSSAALRGGSPLRWSLALRACTERRSRCVKVLLSASPRWQPQGHVSASQSCPSCPVSQEQARFRGEPAGKPRWHTETSPTRSSECGRADAGWLTVNYTVSPSVSAFSSASVPSTRSSMPRVPKHSLKRKWCQSWWTDQLIQGSA